MSCLKMSDEPPGLEEVEPPKGLPSQVSLAGTTWTVKYASNLSSSRNLLGFTDHVQRLIVVEVNQPREALCDTLFHESIHALLSLSACYDLDDDLEERVVRSIAPGISSLARGCSPWFKSG